MPVLTTSDPSYMSPSVAPVRRSGGIARRNARSRAVVRTRRVSPPISSSLLGTTAAIAIPRSPRCCAGRTINDQRVERMWQRPQAQGDRCNRRYVRSLHPRGHSCSHPVRQRTGVRRQALQEWIAVAGAKTAYIEHGSPGRTNSSETRFMAGLVLARRSVWPPSIVLRTQRHVTPTPELKTRSRRS